MSGWRYWGVQDGPGPFVERIGDDSIASVIAEGGGLWFGFDSGGSPAAWDWFGQRIADATRKVDHELASFFLSHRYIEPKPVTPVLTPIEALQLIEDQSVEQTGEYEAFAKFAKQTCRAALVAAVNAKGGV